MPPVSRNSPSDQQDSPKSLCLRPSSLLAACFLVVAAVALAYVGGVMSGRAYWRGHPAQVGVAGGALKKGVVVEPAEEDVPKQKILAAEELRFARVLRGESLPPGMTDGPQARTPAAVAMQPVGAPAAGQRSPAPATPPATPPATGANAGQAAQPVPENHPVVLNSLQPVGNMFDYVFQVGAFKDEESVDSLRQRLEGRGLRTRLQRSGKLLVILVLLRGNEARAAEVVHACEGLNLGKPILRSKTPVKQ